MENPIGTIRKTALAVILSNGFTALFQPLICSTSYNAKIQNQQIYNICNCSGLTYGNRALASDQATEETKNLCRAIDLYAEVALTHFGDK